MLDTMLPIPEHCQFSLMFKTQIHADSVQNCDPIIHALTSMDLHKAAWAFSCKAAKVNLEKLKQYSCFSF